MNEVLKPTPNYYTRYTILLPLNHWRTTIQPQQRCMAGNPQL